MPHTTPSTSCSDYIDLELYWNDNNNTIEFYMEGPVSQWFGITFPDLSSYFTEGNSSSYLFSGYGIIVENNNETNNIDINEYNIDSDTQWTLQSNQNLDIIAAFIDDNANVTIPRTIINFKRSLNNSMDPNNFNFI